MTKVLDVLALAGLAYVAVNLASSAARDLNLAWRLQVHSPSISVFTVALVTAAVCMAAEYIKERRK